MRDENKRSGTDDGKSERSSSTDEAGEPTRGTPWREDERRAAEPREGTTPGHMGPENVSTKLARVAKLARRLPEGVLTTLAHHIDVELLREAYKRTRKDGAVGVDGQTAAEYARALDENLANLLERFQSGTYQAPPVRRVHIPKGDGDKTRPIGIPTFEDKVLQRAVSMVLTAVYEEDFRSCSYGFRPGRSAHQALETLWRGVMKMGGGVVLEVDIQGFFDALVPGHLRNFLDQRVCDGVIRRMIDKWLKAGVLEDGRVTHPQLGSPQGGVVSPLLSNIYLHHVMDTWFDDVIKPKLRGEAFLVRYADDLVIVFEDAGDARRVMDVLPKRFGKYGLTLHPEKTRLVPFHRPRPNPKGKGHDDDGDGPGTFDLLGFTHFWARSRKGTWVVKRKTAASRMRRTLKAIAAWGKAHRHWRVRDQHAALGRKLRGHDGYFGITGNSSSLRVLRHWVERIWRYWLDRRSQNRHMPWERFAALLKRYPLPPPVAVHSVLRRPASP